jgi:hypothetical protein
MIEWLKECQIKEPCIDDSISYSLLKLKKKFLVKELDIESGWLIYTGPKPDEGDYEIYGWWMEFAVMRFHCQTHGDPDIEVSCVFHGEGPANGSLRECRHTWWGEEGYIFYPKRVLIVKALEALSEFYDLD